MRLKDILLWRLDARTRFGHFSFAVMLVAGIGCLRALTGMAYEYRVFFIAPVLLVAWWVDERAGYALALLSAGIGIGEALRS